MVVIILSAKSNGIVTLEPLMPKVARLLENASSELVSGQAVTVGFEYGDE
ncbi:MAG: hypothetical protein ACRDSJ_17775 [Rubrobacteraceae bacterium]